MTATAERIHHYEMIHGRREVEKFLDAVLAIQEHIDPSIQRSKLSWSMEDTWVDDDTEEKTNSPYDDLWDLEDKKKELKGLTEKKRKQFPPESEKDLLLFIEHYSKELEDWQRDILTMMREEMLYFWPQLETKIMNEGWASYWHQRIIREMNLSSGESIEFAKLNAGVIQPSKTQINPYYLGLKIFEDIEERFNKPSTEMKERQGIKPNSGREKIFEVREIESDLSFIRNYLTKDLVLREDMYLFQKQGRDYEIVEKDWKGVRDQIITSRINGGFPFITVENGDYLKGGELYLAHQYEGIELDTKYLEKTLPYLYQLWGRTVHMETVLADRPIVFCYDGRKISKRYV